MHKYTVAELAKALVNKRFSSVELTQHYLQRVQQFDHQLNSFITVTPELALSMAQAADRQRAQGKASLLTGIPIAQKDIFCTKGVKTTCGSKMLDNFIAPYDATIIEHCHQAGLVMLGKTNMDEFAMGASNETSYYGTVKNPWRQTRVPGGSSGGSAAAVAARLTPVATGSDTGGSIRQPAAFCGITGLKPTYGRVSRYGMIAFASSLDQAGIMGKTAEDIALLMQVIAKHDPKDSTSLPIAAPNYSNELTGSLQGLRIGLPKEYFGEGLDPAIVKTIEMAKNVLSALGATFHDITLPNSKLAIPVYYVLAPAECSSNLARYDGVRYGYRCDQPKDLRDLYQRSRNEGFGAEVKRRILMGTYVLSAGFYDAYYVKAQQMRQLIRQDFIKAFEKVDVILGPTTPSTAFALGTKNDDPVSMYLADIYTCAINLAGLPAISMPVGFDQKLPIGMQIIGKDFDEAKLLAIAHHYQQQTDWHQQIPEGF